MPVLSVPLAGPQDYFQNGQGDGVLIICMAALAAILTLAGKIKALWVPGMLSAAVLLYGFFALRSYQSEAREYIRSEFAGNPFMGLGEAAVESVQLLWGWAVLFVGSLVLIGISFNAIAKGSV